METKEIFRIIDNETGKPEGVYQRGNYDQYDFSSIESARSSNCHDTYKDRVKYNISKYRVTIELIDDDIDPPDEKEIKEAEERENHEKEMDDRGIEGFDRVGYSVLYEFKKREEKKAKKRRGYTHFKFRSKNKQLRCNRSKRLWNIKDRLGISA